MKLIAIWVEDYMKFKDQTFNLDSPVEFTFDFNKDTRELSISIKKKDNYVQMFDEPFVSVTAIVGKNGAGKTSFLKLLNVINSTKPLEKPVLLVFQDLEKTKQPSYKIIVYQHDGFLFDQFKGSNRKIQVTLLGELNKLKIKNDLELINHEYKPDPFFKIDVLNYDNLFLDENDKLLYDKGGESTKNQAVLNKKMMYQMITALDMESLNKYIKDFQNKQVESSSLSENNFNPLKLYFDKRIEKRLYFLSNINQDKKFPEHISNKVNLPKSISLIFENDIINNCIKIMEPQHQLLLTSFNSSILRKTNIQFNSGEIKAVFKSYVFRQIINASLIYENSFYKESNKKFTSDFFDFLNQKKIKEDEEQIYFEDNILEEVKKLISKDIKISANKEYTVFQLYNFNKIFLKIDDLIEEVTLTSDSLSIFGFYNIFNIEIDPSTWEIIKLFLDVNVFGMDKFVNISFPNISSGEEAILNQFTEFYESIKSIKDRTNLLILIDEGENHLHPEWQREYLSSIIDFIKHYASNKELKIQLVLTSHSPFILSDLTKNQVVFLNHNNDSNRLGLSVKQENQIETFGANIYDLFKDSFFMDKGFIGEFAKQKIEELFDELIDLRDTQEEITYPEYVKLRQRVVMIGDRIIRTRLEDVLYEIKYQKSANELKAEELEKQARELRNKLN